jgi:hypothetical protein
MNVIENDVFKLVSLRGPGEGSIDPIEGTEDTDVITILRTNPVNPLRPSPDVVRSLPDTVVLDTKKLHGLNTFRIAGRLQSSQEPTIDQLAKVRDSDAAFADRDLLRKEYSRLVDSWLVGRLKVPGFPLKDHERLMRVSRLWRQFLDRPETLRQSNAVSRILDSHFVFPRELKTVGVRSSERPGAASNTQSLETLRGRYLKLVDDIARNEAIQRKAFGLYWETEAKVSAAQPVQAAAPGRTGGLLNRIANVFAGTAVIARSPSVPALALDDGFYSALNSRLTSSERSRLGDLLGSEPSGARPQALHGLLTGVLATDILVLQANDTCSRIRTLEEEQRADLPPPRALAPGAERPSVRAIGWGDLIVARERLIGYDANEIAHIENVLPGEEKVREHERNLKTEQVTETETTTEKESERDLQTTDRNEMQTEVSSVIQENFSVKAGVNTSGRYGLTQVDTSLDAGFERNSTEARSSTVQLAKEVISKTIERVLERVRELRRLTITETIRELNTHTLSNLVENGTPPPISGVYLWVEKIQEVALRHYGTRLMVEFHVPEPGLSLFQHTQTPKTKRPKPAPFTSGPSDILSTNYLCYARAFGARDLEPPPALFVDVGYTWRSAPDEEAEGGNAEDTIADTIPIPAGYRPFSGTASITAIPVGPANVIYLYVAIAGREVIEATGHSRDARWTFDQGAQWPNGLPVSMLAHGHFDKTLVVHITLRCQRTPEAMTAWQIQTWQKIREAHELLVQDYERSVLEAEAGVATLFQVLGHPASVNRSLERDELKKWSIKTMRVESFTDDLVDAVVQVGAHAEIDPVAADAQAPIVRFFEESFEWREMSYFLYPYFWGRRGAWDARLSIGSADATHDLFLRAGAARVIVPVTPGYEDRVLHYLDSDPSRPELQRIAKAQPGEVPPESDAEQLWLDLLVEKNADLALGSGTLSVVKDNPAVQINTDSQWDATDRDEGRELYIAGERYVVTEVVATRQIRLDRPYEGTNDSKAKYSTGSVPFGAPWLVRVPTSLVILRENTGLLNPT